MMYEYPIPYTANAASLFQQIRHLSHAVWLDSGVLASRSLGDSPPSHPAEKKQAQQQGGQKSYDVLTAAPTDQFRLALSDKHDQKSTPLDQRLISQFTKWASRYDVTLKLKKNQPGPTTDQASPLTPLNSTLSPYTPGLFGFLSYDAGQYLEPIQLEKDDDVSWPAIYVGFYPWVIVLNHALQQTTLKSLDATITPDSLGLTAEMPPTVEGSAPSPFEQQSPWRSNITQTQYQHAFEKIQHYIQSGDCYQVNLAQRFSSTFKGDPFEGYLRLRQANPAPFSAFLDMPFGHVMSLSPERFITVEDQQAMTQPIKGTTPRSSDPALDELAKQALAKSTKDRAENLMITDLLRNDFGKRCLPGSIKTDPIFDIESFANVHHMVSTIHGKLPANTHPLTLFTDCFPGGSITGAPKRRSMQIIHELEPHQRHLYCGSLFHCGIDGYFTSNITIRTLIYWQNQLFCWAGGGIVSDSTSEGEYQETLDKVNRLLSTLGSF